MCSSIYISCSSSISQESLYYYWLAGVELIIGSNYFSKALKTAPKTFKIYFSTPQKFLLTLLLLPSKNTILYALKQKYLSKMFQQVLMS